MQEVLKKDYKNFLYGDKEETLLVVKNKFPNSKIDFYPPPFRELTPEEDEKIIEKINSTKPDILWVGLGLPKQEKWIYRHKDRLNAPVIIGVGAAFKFLAGTKKRAPKWMGSIGLEWLWRLLTEPKVVWKRVFIDMPYFFWLVVKDLFF
jgi:N-acetylglucosaminyldiphosphoundecaprenol N-acetyl-beta-D-mannosaminyltransferase